VQYNSDDDDADGTIDKDDNADADGIANEDDLIKASFAFGTISTRCRPAKS